PSAWVSVPASASRRCGARPASSSRQCHRDTFQICANFDSLFACARPGGCKLANALVDILIIGSGASGAAAARRLSDAGFRVLCLEQGRWQNPHEYPTRFADWEFRAASSFSYNPNVRGLPEDYPVNDSASAISPLMFNAVGGSTIHWTAHTPRF